MTENRKTIEIIIPVFNGEKTLIPLTERIHSSLSGHPVRLLFVDDGSRDGSRDRILELQQRYPYIRSHFHRENQGQQQAVLRGLSMIETDSDYVVTMDDDLQNPPELLPRLLAEIRQGRDLVYGVPEGQRGPLYRRVGSQMRDLLFTLFLGKPRGVEVSAYRIMTRELAQKIANAPGSFFYFSAEAFRHKPLRATHILYPYRPRLHGTSSYDLPKLVRLYGRILYHYVIRRNR